MSNVGLVGNPTGSWPLTYITHILSIDFWIACNYAKTVEYRQKYCAIMDAFLNLSHQFIVQKQYRLLQNHSFSSYSLTLKELVYTNSNLKKDEIFAGVKFGSELFCP